MGSVGIFFNTLLAPPAWKTLRIGKAFRPKSYAAYLFSVRKAPSMPRLLAATMVALALVALTTGCRMGGNPLDYCGPVYCGGTIPPCAQDVRAGSILSPPAGL